MLHIKLIAVGKLKETYLREGCAEYIKRLQAFCKLSIHEIEEERLPNNPSRAQILAALHKEGKRITALIPASAYVIPLCIEGEELDSPGLAQVLHQAAIEGTSVLALLIGGSYGLSQEVKGYGRLMLSMSRMTFPHQLARMMLLEQIYRAFQIDSNGKYHK